MAVAQTFPTFRLPNDAHLQILKQMDYIELISLSFASKKSKELVKSLDLRCDKLCVIPFETFRIMVFGKQERGFVFDLKLTGNRCKNFAQLPVNVRVRDYNKKAKSVRWTNQGRHLKQWVTHIHSLFRFSTPVAFWVLADEAIGYNFQSFRDDLPKFSCLEIIINDDDVVKETSREMLKTFGSDVKKISLSGDPTNETYTIQHLVTQNLDELCWGPKEMTLDDLLVMNSKHIEMDETSKIHQTHLNRFLKHWIRGSNPRLSYLSILYPSDEPLVVNVLLEGIHHQPVPYVAERVQEYKSKKFRGGFNIRNKHGMLATVRLLKSRKAFEFYVWNSYYIFCCYLTLSNVLHFPINPSN